METECGMHLSSEFWNSNATRLILNAAVVSPQLCLEIMDAVGEEGLFVHLPRILIRGWKVLESIDITRLNHIQVVGFRGRNLIRTCSSQPQHLLQHLGRFLDLTYLDLSNNSLGQSLDLVMILGEILPRFERLEQLGLSGNGISYIDGLEIILNSSSLWRLVVVDLESPLVSLSSKPSTTGFLLSNRSGIKSLTHLEVNRLDSIEPVTLSSMTSLKALACSITQSSAHFAMQLMQQNSHHFKTLKFIFDPDFTGYQVSKLFECIANLASLESLVIIGNQKKVGILYWIRFKETIRQLNNLAILRIDSVDFRELGARETEALVGGMKSVEILELKPCYPSGTIYWLFTVPSLKSLTLSGDCHYKDKAFDEWPSFNHLYSIPNIEILSIKSFHSVPPDFFTALSHMQSINSLELEQIPVCQHMPELLHSLSNLSHLKSLTLITCGGHYTSPKHLHDMIKSLPNLERLELKGNQFHRQQIDAIGHALGMLTKIRVVKIGSERYSDRSIIHLGLPPYYVPFSQSIKIIYPQLKVFEVDDSIRSSAQ